MGIGTSDIIGAKTDIPGVPAIIVTGEASGTRPHRGLIARAAAAEVGILLYRGCQSAMVHGLTDMLGNRKRRFLGARRPRLATEPLVT
jgi:hypothetical protein